MDDQERESMLISAKKCGATIRLGRVSFPHVEALAMFSDAWVHGAAARRWEQAVAAVASPGDTPLPAAEGYWGHDWPHRVEAYARHHGVARAEVFRRVADATGANIQSMSLRFQKAKPSWTIKKAIDVTQFDSIEIVYTTSDRFGDGQDGDPDRTSAEAASAVSSSVTPASADPWSLAGRGAGGWRVDHHWDGGASPPA